MNFSARQLQTRTHTRNEKGEKLLVVVGYMEHQWGPKRRFLEAESSKGERRRKLFSVWGGLRPVRVPIAR